MSNNARVLEGKLAVVTGASRGIGAAICENLAAKGCSLIMNYTSNSSKSLTEDLAKELEKDHNIQTTIVQADMGTPEGPGHIIETARGELSKSGPFKIDIVINNAGVMTNNPVQDCTAEDFALIFDINVRGPLLLVKAAFPYLPTDRSGRIVNISSISSMCGLANNGVYGGSKGALEAMTRTWARELAERCTVNAINAGPVDGDMYNNNDEGFYERIGKFNQLAPLMKVRPGIDDERVAKMAKAAGGTRPAYDWEIAGIVGMICTPESAWCTGSTISANGGFKFNF